VKATGTFARYVALARLPILVRRQRRLERKVAKLQAAEEQERQVREQILEALKLAGIEAKGVVTCIGYEVIRRTRAGRRTVNAEKLLAVGVPLIDVQWATEVGKAADYVEVRPMKGAEVKAA